MRKITAKFPGKLRRDLVYCFKYKNVIEQSVLGSKIFAVNVEGLNALSAEVAAKFVQFLEINDRRQKSVPVQSYRILTIVSFFDSELPRSGREIWHTTDHLLLSALDLICFHRVDLRNSRSLLIVNA